MDDYYIYYLIYYGDDYYRYRRYCYRGRGLFRGLFAFLCFADRLLGLRCLCCGLKNSEEALIGRCPSIFSLERYGSAGFSLYARAVCGGGTLGNLFFSVCRRRGTSFFCFSLSGTYFYVRGMDDFTVSMAFTFRVEAAVEGDLTDYRFPTVRGKRSRSFFPGAPVFLLFLFRVPVVCYVFTRSLR